MKAVILAAGMATRLRPLTNDTPKCLLRIGKCCLLERTVDVLVGNGINEIAVVTGYRSQQIIEFLNVCYPDISFEFIYNDRYETTNNIYSLWLTRKFSEGNNILLLDSDILFDPQIIPALINFHKRNALALNRHELGEEEIKVIIDNDGKVLEISKTCSPQIAIGESVGIEKMSGNYTTALFAELEQMIEKEHLDNVFYEQAFERIIKKGHYFYIKDTTDLFSIELDTVEDFKQAQILIPKELY